jgi:DtxR family Mn-dependent transcriptional regulator
LSFQSSGNQPVFHTVRGYELLEQHKRILTPAMEDYLEMIYRNGFDDNIVMISTLSDNLNVRPPSATKMVQKLAELGMLKYKRYGYVLLTETGSVLAKFLYERHNILELFLKNLGVNENLLIETELIEHSISKTTLNRFIIFNSFFLKNPGLLKQLQSFNDTD